MGTLQLAIDVEAEHPAQLFVERAEDDGARGAAEQFACSFHRRDDVVLRGGGECQWRVEQRAAPEVKQRLGVVRAELPDHRDNIFVQPAGAKRRKLLGARHQNRGFMRKAARSEAP